MNSERSVTLETLKNISVEEFLNLLRQNEAIAVQFPSGESLIVQVKRELTPLPVLDGYVPMGWKAAIYEP